MFHTFCERNGEVAADGKKNRKLHKTSKSVESVGVTSGVTSMFSPSSCLANEILTPRSNGYVRGSTGPATGL